MTDASKVYMLPRRMAAGCTGLTPVQPGTWGCTHGDGWIFDGIRAAELRMSRSARFPAGDTEASWAGHCVVFAGDQNFGTASSPDIRPAIVQAMWPQVQLAPVTVHSDYVWASRQPLTTAQRAAGVTKVMGMVGDGYDLLAYLHFIHRAAQMRLTRNLAPLFTDPRWVICSGLVVVEQEAMGVDTTHLLTAATENPDFVCPADCMRWGLDSGWMSFQPA
jgi:hypothetical protein